MLRLTKSSSSPGIDQSRTSSTLPSRVTLFETISFLISCLLRCRFDSWLVQPLRHRPGRLRNGRSVPSQAGVLTGDDRDRISRCERLVPGDALGEATLARARAGDEGAFRELTEPHRRELQLHCYRILGTMQDAEDLVQETLLAAWRSLEAFEGRASVRTWLYQIATNRCLNALRAASRRPQEVPAMAQPLEPTRWIEPVWLEPYPDVLLDDIPDRTPGPSTRYEARESCELAFIV